MPLACPACGSVKPPYHFGYRPRNLFDLPIRMKPVQLLARRRRYQCKDCGDTFLDGMPSICQAHDATERLVSNIETHALQLTCTFTALAHDLRVSEKFVSNMFQAHIGPLERDYVIQILCSLGIDEIYVEDATYCVLTDLERHCVIDLLPKRDMESVKRWLAQLKILKPSWLLQWLYRMILSSPFETNVKISQVCLADVCSATMILTVRIDSPKIFPEQRGYLANNDTRSVFLQRIQVGGPLQRKIPDGAPAPW